MTANDTAKTASLSLGRSPYSKGASRLQADLEKPVTHTPGPWKAFSPLGEGDYGVLSPNVNAGGNFYVATLPNGSHAEAEANAKLIAAAPALLAEVESLRKTLADALDNMPYLFPSYGRLAGLTPEAKAWREKLQAATKSARAALTLATGGAK